MKKRNLQMKRTKRIVLIALLLSVVGMGKMDAQNLIVNGDFEETNFNYQTISDYTRIWSGGVQQGQFIHDNTSTNHGIGGLGWPANLTGYGGSGYYLLFNGFGGSQSSTKRVWWQQVNVTTQTTYTFKCYVRNLSQSSWLFNVNPSIIQVKINGSAAGNNVTLDVNNYDWVEITRTWNSGNVSGPIDIEIFDVYTGNPDNGDDFALDHLSLTSSQAYSVNAVANPAESGTITGAGAYQNGETCTLVAAANEGYVFDSWTKDGEVVSYLSTYSFTVTESVELTAVFIPLSGTLVGEAEGTNEYLPSYSYYKYTLSQQIYTPEDLGGVGTISSISYFNTGGTKTRSYDIYMVHTDKVVFESNTDWIAVTEGDLVFSGEVTMAQGCWNAIVFDTPFAYDGTSNLAVIVDDNSGNWTNAPHMSCRVYNAEGIQAIRVYGDTPDYDPYYPYYYNGTLYSEKNQMILNRQQSVVNAVPNDAGMGSVSGAGWYAIGDTCTLTATVNEGYCFYYWTENGTMVSSDATYSFSVTRDVNLVANFGLPLSITAFSDPEGGGDVTGVGEYDYGFACTLTATANNGYTFMYWTENGEVVSADNPYTFTVTTDRELVANFHPLFVITASSNPQEGGNITGAGAYDYNSECTLTATANEGYSFYYWTEDGAVVSSDVTYSFIVTGDRDLVANFGLPINITVTVNPEEGGIVNGGGNYGYSQTCFLTAVANEGYVFDNWTKDGEVVSYLSTYSFTVTESVEFTAVFIPLSGTLVGEAGGTNAYLPSYSYYKYTLSQQIYTPEDLGGVGAISSISYFNTGGTKTRSYDIYMVHTDKAVFESNTDWIAVTEGDLVFSGEVTMAQGCWNAIVFDTPFAYDGTSNLAVIVDDNSGNWTNAPHMSCRVFNTEGIQAIRVYSDNPNYDPYYPSGYGYNGTLYSEKNQMILNRQQSVVNAVPNDTEMGTISGAGWYAIGDTCTLTATANEGYCFYYWTENGSMVSSDATYSFSVTRDMNLVANFGLSLSITAFSDPEEGGYITGVGEYDYGSTCMLTATANYGYTFMYWTENGEVVSADNPYTFTVTTDRELVANFHPLFVITASSSPEEGGTVSGAGAYDYNSECTLTATANEGYSFYYWTEDGAVVSSDAVYSFIVTGDRNLVANFGTPINVAVTVSPEQGGIVNGGGNYGYSQTCFLTAEANEGYVFDNWTKDGEVVSYLSTYSFTVTESVELTAVFIPFSGILVGEAEGTNEYLPSYSYYKYTLSQQIYTPEDLGGVGAISSISYFNTGGTKTRSYDIYMVHTDKTFFESNTDWIAVTEGDLVFSGEVTMAQGCWNAIILDTPFVYDGTSNLAVIVDDNSGNWTNAPHMSCRVFNAEDIQAIRVYSDNPNYDPCYPSGYGYNGTLYSEKNQMILNQQYVVNAVPNDLSMGSVIGSGMHLSGSTCTLTATANPGYHFINWTEDNEEVSSDAEYAFIVNGDRNLVANFNTNQYSNHWTAESYQNSMFMIGKVMIDGIEQVSPILELGAFCNDECRGSALPVLDGGQWLYFMTIDGNSGDDITFRLYDHAIQQELNYYCFNVIPFEVYGLIGIDEPYEVQFASTLSVSVDVNPENAGTVEGTGEYAIGEYVTLTATANEGYLFNSWTLDGEIVSTEPSYSFTVTEPVSLTANFDILYSVSVDVNMEEAGVVTGEGEYLSGTEVTLTATANEGYIFNNWTLDGEIVSTEPSYTFTVTESVNLTANFHVVRTQQLIAGWNWWSSSLEITLNDLKTALVEALPGTTITIKSKTKNIVYNPNTNQWRGTLSSFDVAQMYSISVSAACEITLTGVPIDPTAHPVTIHNGVNWIGFPLGENMLVNDALAGFPAISGDIIKSKTNNTIYIRGEWRGAVTNFEPGQGYKFISNAQETRTLIFGTDNNK